MKIGTFKKGSLAALTILTAAALVPVEVLAAAAPASPPDIFATLYSDLGFAAAGSLIVGALVLGLRSLRDAGYLSERWRFGEECERD